jgi:hypothetical protein
VSTVAWADAAADPSSNANAQDTTKPTDPIALRMGCAPRSDVVCSVKSILVKTP